MKGHIDLTVNLIPRRYLAKNNMIKSVSALFQGKSHRGFLLKNPLKLNTSEMIRYSYSLQQPSYFYSFPGTDVSPQLFTRCKVNSPSTAVPCVTPPFELWTYDSWSCLANVLGNFPSTLLLIIPPWKLCIHQYRIFFFLSQLIRLWFFLCSLSEPNSIIFANNSCHNLGQKWFDSRLYSTKEVTGGGRSGLFMLKVAGLLHL